MYYTTYYTKTVKKSNGNEVEYVYCIRHGLKRPYTTRAYKDLCRDLHNSKLITQIGTYNFVNEREANKHEVSKMPVSAYFLGEW